MSGRLGWTDIHKSGGDTGATREWTSRRLVGGARWVRGVGCVVVQARREETVVDVAWGGRDAHALPNAAYALTQRSHVSRCGDMGTSVAVVYVALVVG